MDPTPVAGILETLITNYGPPGLIIAYLLYDRSKLSERLTDITDRFIDVSAKQSEAAANTAAAMNRLADGLNRAREG